MLIVKVTRFYIFKNRIDKSLRDISYKEGKTSIFDEKYISQPAIILPTNV